MATPPQPDRAPVTPAPLAGTYTRGGAPVSAERAKLPDSPRRKDRSRTTRRPAPSLELMEPLRAVINRQELRSSAPFPRAIAVMPVSPSDDAVTAALSLATIFAEELGDSTCWVNFGWLDAGAPTVDNGDSGVRKSSLDIALAATAYPGLSEATFSSVDPGRAHAAIRSSEFVAELDRLRHTFDRLVFAVPSVVTNPATLAVLPHADASILVSSYRSTRVHDVEQAITASAPTPNVAVLVTRYDPSIPRLLRRIVGG